MKTTIRLSQRLMQLCLAASLGGMAVMQVAAAASGQFTYVIGEVFVESQGKRVAATRGLEVNPGDLIISGDSGMAQLSMVDQARLSLRSNSQLRIEGYATQAEGKEGAILSLLRGTLRTFTGLLTPANRERYQMKTRVATVGIRGSGNILVHDPDRDETINHTIEGSHIVMSNSGNFSPIITRPNDTIRVEIGKPPERIPTPANILAAANTMTNKATTATAATNTAASDRKGTAGRNVPPPDSNRASAGAGGGNASTGTSTVVGSNGLGFMVVPNNPVALVDPERLLDVVVSGIGQTGSGQALPGQVALDNGNLRAFQFYGALQSPTATRITGGTATDVQTIDLGNNNRIVIGRWVGADNFFLFGSADKPAGSVHWGYGSAGYPAYLSDVLTGTVSYTQAGATTPTNQLGAGGMLTSAALSVNFTARTLNTNLGISLGNSSWTLTANNVPIAFNSFFAFTGAGLTITNNAGQNSDTNFNLFGSLEGSLVGAGLNGAILGYGFTDLSNTANSQTINGVVAFQGPLQNTSVAYRDGIVSDPTLALAPAPFAASFTTTNRPTEVAADDLGRVTTFTAPYVRGEFIVGHLPYAVGTARVSDNGFDPTTGLVWGRWSEGSATIGGQSVALNNRSLHYIFGPSQTAPVALPLTGQAQYSVVGATSPTDTAGNIGKLNSASLNANFSSRTVDTNLNLTIAGQTWNASASGVPIVRGQYFTASANPRAGDGIPRPALLQIGCTPNCTPVNPRGSIDGFFTGRTGQGAGVMYNLNGTISGAIAFGRRGS